ncbi:phage minor capsid protein [Streptomonospora sp. PA3]|uniref:phage minor capsid protein n=1 Tax=Streptomonospora sp. PA3 TaxID=2607326 RepID=UPI001CA3EB60
MPVEPDDIEAIVQHAAAIYREAELALYRQLARHFQRYPGAPGAGAGEVRLEAIGQLRRSVESIQAALEADGSAALRESIAAAWRLGDRSALVDLPRAWWPESGIGDAAAAARAVVPQSGAIESLASALVRDVGRVVSNILRDVFDAYRETVAGATARMLAGGQTRREATQAAWSALVDRGIVGFQDRAGRMWRLHSYAEMAVRTASARAAVQGQTDRLGSLGVDLVYVSDHAQQCPLCRPWESTILHRVAGPSGRITVPHALSGEPIEVDVAGSLPEARAAGLFHPNCRHSVSAYLPGVTRIPEPRDQDPDAYEARMRQRYLERQIRKAKAQEAAALDDDARKAARKKIRARQAALRDHLADNPSLKRLRYREQLGAGSTPPPDRRDDAVTPLGPDVQPDLLGGGQLATPSTRRDEPAPADEQAPAAGAGQTELGELTTAELRAMTDGELEARALDFVRSGADWDSPGLRRFRRELDRRDRAARQREERRQTREQREAEQHAAMAELVEQGVPWDEAAAEVLGQPVEAIRRRMFTQEQRAGADDRRSFQQLAREQYRLYIERRYVEAETELRGVMVNAAGERAGINYMSLFSGPRSRVEKYASEELKNWFDQHGRMTFSEFVDSIEQGRYRGGTGRDFNR